MRVFKDLDDVAASVGETIGPTGWIPISQRRVNAFADATDDHQWIHVDRERAAESPFGGTIAHGYLTLSMLPMIAMTSARRRPTARTSSDFRFMNELGRSCQR